MSYQKEWNFLGILCVCEACNVLDILWICGCVCVLCAQVRFCISKMWRITIMIIFQIPFSTFCNTLIIIRITKRKESVKCFSVLQCSCVREEVFCSEFRTVLLCISCVQVFILPVKYITWFTYLRVSNFWLMPLYDIQLSSTANKKGFMWLSTHKNYFVFQYTCSCKKFTRLANLFISLIYYKTQHALSSIIWCIYKACFFVASQVQVVLCIMYVFFVCTLILSWYALFLCLSDIFSVLASKLLSDQWATLFLFNYWPFWMPLWALC